MIRSFEIKNFKCFRGVTTLGLGGVTLLSGVNGVGKSSFLQGLLLLRQSHQDGEGLRLNGDLLEVGQSTDALCSDAEDDELSFGLTL